MIYENPSLYEDVFLQSKNQGGLIHQESTRSLHELHTVATPAELALKATGDSSHSSNSGVPDGAGLQLFSSIESRA